MLLWLEVLYEGRSESFLPHTVLVNVQSWNFYQLLLLLNVWSSKSYTFLPPVLHLSNTRFVEPPVFAWEIVICGRNDIVIGFKTTTSQTRFQCILEERGKSLTVRDPENKADAAIFHSRSFELLDMQRRSCAQAHCRAVGKLLALAVLAFVMCSSLWIMSNTEPQAIPSSVAMFLTFIRRSFIINFSTSWTISSLLAVEGLPVLGSSWMLSRPHLNCLHQCFTTSYDGQLLRYTSSISSWITFGVFFWRKRNLITDRYSIFSITSGHYRN